MKEVSSELEERGNEGIRDFREVRGVVPVLVDGHKPLVRLQCPHVISNHIVREVILGARVHIPYGHIADSSLTMTSMAMNMHGESSL